jgi:hypothetical protein
VKPPIFRVLCEVEGIWNGPPDDWVDDSTNFDVKGDTLDTPDCQPTGHGSQQDSLTDSRLPQGDQSLAVEPAAGVWDTLAE